MIREQSTSQSFTTKTSPYPKELEGLWVAKINLLGLIFDNQDHESGHCICKCTPIPKDVRSVASDDKRHRKREDRHHMRGRPSAHLQGAND